MDNEGIDQHAPILRHDKLGRKLDTFQVYSSWHFSKTVVQCTRCGYPSGKEVHVLLSKVVAQGAVTAEDKRLIDLITLMLSDVYGVPSTVCCVTSDSIRGGNRIARLIGAKFSNS